MSDQGQQVAVVTGSSKGIGAGIARQAAAAGFDTYVTYNTDQKGAAKVIEEIERVGGSAHCEHLDVSDEASVASLFGKIGDRHGKLDLLVNNAVRELSTPIADQSLDDWKTVLAVKLDGAFLCTKAALPLFESSGSAAMIALSSFEAEQPSPEHPAYGVATAGIDAFVKAMALYLPRFGARCNAVCPGAVRTPLWEGDGLDDDEMWQRLAENNPVGRNATPDDVGQVVVALAKDPTRMLNGNFVYVNGGNHLREP